MNSSFGPARRLLEKKILSMMIVAADGPNLSLGVHVAVEEGEMVVGENLWLSFFVECEMNEVMGEVKVCVDCVLANNVRCGSQ